MHHLLMQHILLDIYQEETLAHTYHLIMQHILLDI